MKQTNKMDFFILLKIKLWFETQTNKKLLQTGRKNNLLFSLFVFVAVGVARVLFVPCYITRTHNAMWTICSMQKSISHKKYIRKKYKQRGCVFFLVKKENLMYYIQKSCVILETFNGDAKTMWHVRMDECTSIWYRSPPLLLLLLFILLLSVVVVVAAAVEHMAFRHSYIHFGQWV